VVELVDARLRGSDAQAAAAVEVDGLARLRLGES
jgi:hypothetical protein